MDRLVQREGLGKSIKKLARLSIPYAVFARNVMELHVPEKCFQA